MVPKMFEPLKFDCINIYKTAFVAINKYMMIDKTWKNGFLILMRVMKAQVSLCTCIVWLGILYPLTESVDSAERID